MRRLILAACAAALMATCLPSVSAGDRAAPRFWTDNTRSFSVEATVAKFDRRTDEVTLRLKDGSEVVVPLRRLSQSDLGWLETNFGPEKTEVKGITWFTKFADASAAAAGSKSVKDDKPIMCFRALGDLTGFM